MLRAVHVAGSTTLQPRIQRAAEAFMDQHPGATIVFVGGAGTARGYKALLDQTLDIAMASGYLPPEFTSRVAEQRIELHSTVVSHDAIVPLVHASNPVSNLSMRQLRNIFSGRSGNWSEFGWSNAAIEVLAGPPGGGVTNSWKELVLGEEDTYTPATLVLNTADRLARGAARPFAISYVSHMLLPDRRLKMVRVDGLMADGASHAYPLRVPMLLVTRAAPSAAARAFIAYAAAGSKHE
jgi:phosphate transport system substrate-binding protein